MAIPAVDEVVRGGAVVAIGAVCGVFAPVELITVHAVAAVLAFAHVQAVFDEVAARTQVGIPAEGEEMVKLAVLIVHLQCACFRDIAEKFLKLLKERTGKIEIPAIVLRIPMVRPPACRTIDGERIPCREGGNARFPTQIAVMPGEVPLIAHGKPPLQPAVRAEGGWWDQVFLPSECWRYLLVEREIAIRDFE